VETNSHSKTLAISSLLLICTWLHGRPALVTLPPNSYEDYRISKEVSLVVLPVSVTDREGHFVSGLDVSNFRIYDDGHLEQVTLFQRDDIPLIAGLVVDRSESMAAQSREVLEGAMAFVQSSNPEDKEFVVNFNDRVRLGLPPNIPFTTNVDNLRAALTTPRAIGETALYDAIVVGLEHLQEGQAEKKVLILISDGGDNVSKYDFVHVVQIAQTLNVPIYSVGLLDPSNSDQRPDILKALSRQTGGEAYFPSTPARVAHVCQKIASDIRHHYTLGYNPAPDRQGGYRKIRVEAMASDRAKLFVRTRTSYFLPATPHSDFSTHEGQDR
jgi:Ca-activated chloride channel family protein